MKIGDLVKCSGVSQKGKSRIKELGEFWTVVRITDGKDLQFAKSDKLFVLLQSLKKDWVRWVAVSNDQHFKIEVNHV